MSGVLPVPGKPTELVAATTGQREEVVDRTVPAMPSWPGWPPAGPACCTVDDTRRTVRLSFLAG